MTRLPTIAAAAFLLGGVLGFACGGKSTVDVDDPGTTPVGFGGSTGTGGARPAGASTAGTAGGTAGVSGAPTGMPGPSGGAGRAGTSPAPVPNPVPNPTPTAGTGGTSTGNPSASAGCPVSPSQCTDGIDNDGDGKIDAADPECSGPCDNAEGSFATGIPGDNIDDLASCKQDCFFDGNSGGEDDGCQFDLRCDPARASAMQCKFGTQPPGVRCEAFNQQSDQCRRVCGRLTPNGCDCFGCCQVPGTNFAVRLTPTCTAAALNDPAKCQRCTPVPSCHNTCEKCEVCYGKPAPDPGCSTPTPGTTTPPSGAGGTGGSGGGTGGAGGSSGSGSPCAPGVVYCGSDPKSCPAGKYCLTGCCITPIE